MTRNIKMPFELSDESFEKNEKDEYSDPGYEKLEMKSMEVDEY